MVEKRPKIHPLVKCTVVNNEGVIVAQEDGELHIVNEVASFLLPLCNGDNSLSDLIRQVVENFDVDESTATEDITEFLKELEDKRIIVNE